MKHDHWKRIRLYQLQGGRCHWCGRSMVLVVGATQDGRSPLRKEPAIDNLATFEHLNSRLSPDRTATCRGEQRIVLACLRCNNDRASKEVATTLSVDEQRRRAGRWPQDGEART